jgi:hypothetical protein
MKLKYIELRVFTAGPLENVLYASSGHPSFNGFFDSLGVPPNVPVTFQISDGDIDAIRDSSFVSKSGGILFYVNKTTFKIPGFTQDMNHDAGSLTRYYGFMHINDEKTVDKWTNGPSASVTIGINPNERRHGGGARREGKKGKVHVVAKWVSTGRNVTIKATRTKPSSTKRVFRNSATGELRVRKMAVRPDGSRRATYVRF